jgi:hypothetical protein
MKTLLILQLNYLGSFLIPSCEVLSRIQLAIDKFVIKNISFAVNRRYLPPESSGLGLFDFGIFFNGSTLQLGETGTVPTN